MEAIIAHPAKGAKRSPARKTAAPAPQSSTPDKQASWKPVELKPTALHEAAAFIKQSVANSNAEVWAMADSDSGDDLEMGLANLMTWLDRKIDVEGLEFGVDPVAAFSLLQQDIRSVISVLRCALSYRQLPGLVDVVGALENSVGAAMDIELALRNGAKPFRDRPTPPIRQVDKAPGTPAQAGYLHSASDIDAVFRSFGIQCLSLRDFLIDICTSVKTGCGERRTVDNLLIAQQLICLMGSMVDQMTDTPVLGSTADWVTGDAIERIGGAA